MKMKWWCHVVELDFEAHALRERLQLSFWSYFEQTVQQHACRWSRNDEIASFKQEDN